jgi:hypothetical protein
MTDPEKIKTSTGREISKEEMSKVMFVNGDGRITRNSFLPPVVAGKTEKSLVKTIFPVKLIFFFCADHQKLLNNETIQNNYLTQLLIQTVSKDSTVSK